MTFAQTAAAAVARCSTFAGNKLRQRRRRSLAYGTIVVASIVAALLFLFNGPNSAVDNDITAVALAAGYVDFETPPTVSDVNPRQVQSRGLPPMSSLIEQLELRLAAEPGDSKGWTLLAQSYAYVGNRSGAESAIANAVLLGVDESTLRSQVAIVNTDHRLRPGL